MNKPRDGVVITETAPKGPSGYQMDKVLANDDDIDVRRKLAARTDVAPEILYYLAEDSDPDVRKSIAANNATPRQADVILARDDSEQVRTELARKIARLAPDLSNAERSHLEGLTVEALTILGHDAIPRIRQIIAEEIKHLDNVPKELINDLARDLELIVAAPILEFSPLLKDSDLLEIINSGPIQGALSAVSRRASLDAVVCDAIAGTDDEDAIAALLANDSAQIREETLDNLIDRAPEKEPWHKPLVLRPHLSSRAVNRIARFVTASLLTILENRHELDPEVTREVAGRVDERLSDPEAAAAEEAKALHDQGLLNDELINGRFSHSDRAFLIHAVALLAKMKPAAVKQILQSKSAKGITALAWKAGLSMRTAIAFQSKIAGLKPNALLYAKDGTDFPLEPDDMTWRLQMFDE